ncbi:HK97 family phage prohead protease, partial [Candidatus Pacearchaeota archaeon]|nr:HK97 family phage prohead protease [Candidatus Pacearchaeota archaeon]
KLGEDDNNFTFKGHLAVFNNVDSGYDKIIPGAFKEFLIESKEKKEEVIPIFWVHRSSEPVGIFPIGEMSEDSKGLAVTGLMPKDDTFVSGRVIPQMRIGSVRKMSIGYDTIDYNMDGRVRELLKVHLWEGSLVPLAMNDEARIIDMKAVVPFGDLPLADRARAWDATSALGRLREWAGMDDGDEGSLEDPDVQKQYQKAHFWYDSEDPDMLGSYKLPFADIIDGKLTAIPRGIFAAAAAMQGSREGVYLYDRDRPGVTRNIEKYYEKLGMESPFSKAFRLDDLSCVDERTLEKILKGGVKFSNKMAPAIVSAIKSAGLRDVESEGLRDEVYNAAVIKRIDEILTDIKP